MTFVSRKRWALAALGLAAGGGIAYAYYALALGPAIERYRESSDQLVDLGQEIQSARQELAGADQSLATRQDLEQRANEVGAAISVPIGSEGFVPVLQSILESAEDNSVEIVSLRSHDSEDDASRSITMEGFATVQGFASFLSRISGLRIDAVELSNGEDEASSLRFSVQAATLPAADLAVLSKERGSHDSLPPVEVSEGLFGAPPAREKVPDIAPAVAAGGSDAAGPSAQVEVENDPADTVALRLAGISTFGSQQVAVIVDEDTGQDNFVTLGGRVGGYVLEEISDTSVLIRSGDRTVRLALSGVPRRSEPSSTRTRVKEPGNSASPGPPDGATPLAAAAGGSMPEAIERLGVAVIELPPGSRLRGTVPVDGRLLVVRVENPGSGLQIGDIVIAISGVITSSAEAAIKLLDAIGSGIAIVVQVLRDGKELPLQMVVR